MSFALETAAHPAGLRRVAIDPVSRVEGHGKVTLLLISNGIVSIGSALWTIIDVDWVMKPVGLVAYFVWNVLMIVMMISIYLFSKKQYD